MQYRRFSLTEDFATNSQAWWAIRHGHLDPFVTGLGVSFWRDNAEFVLLAKYLPGYAAQALSGSATRGISRLIPLLTWWEGTVLLLAYGVVFAVAGSLTTLRADVT